MPASRKTTEAQKKAEEAAQARVDLRSDARQVKADLTKARAEEDFEQAEALERELLVIRDKLSSAS